MQHDRTKRAIWALPLIGLISACGGVGSGGVASALSPTGTPSPGPAFDTSGPAGFYPLDSDAALVSVAAGIRQTGEGSMQTQTVETYGSDEMKIDYDPATQDYTIAIPGQIAGRTVENTTDATPSPGFRYFDVIDPQGARVGWVSVEKKVRINLTYTAIGDFSWRGAYLEFVTGIPTPEAEIPLAGSARYSAQVRGQSTAATNIKGTLQLNFDFASTGLSGQMDLTANDGTGGYRSIGAYPIADGVHPVGSTTFSGDFTAPAGLTGPATFEGRFMGRDAAEVGGRWQVPIEIPSGSAFPPAFQGIYEAAGVFAGARR
ncbi:exported hypothetical protein [Novosphingobium sp. KN65.2]|nr:exported hypothetical protein [Novosphingobium sp. KN65.2]